MSRDETYNDFVDKFKPKLTTDDCYTPPAVYDAVLKWVRDNADIGGLEVLRPFYPGGDYKSVNYQRACVVIDNPPFSIFTEIVRYYIEHDVLFFLFAPHLTLFTSADQCCRIITDTSIVYANGAKVNTAFITNLFPGVGIMGSTSLRDAIMNAQKTDKPTLPKYIYPDNIVTVSRISAIVNKGTNVTIPSYALAHCSGLDSQKKIKKSIFGSGYIVSDSVVAMLAAAEKAAAEKAAAEKAAAEKAAAKKVNATMWSISDRERIIIQRLNRKSLNLF